MTDNSNTPTGPEEDTSQPYDIWNPPDAEGAALFNWSQTNDGNFYPGGESNSANVWEPYSPETSDYDAQQYMYDSAQSQPSGYWEDPQNIGRWYQNMKLMPNEQTLPPTLDVAGIQQAYDYMAKKYPGVDYTQWGKLDDNDPMLPVLRNMAPPPPEFMRPDEMTKMANGAYTINGNQASKAPPINGVYTINKDAVDKIDPSAAGKYQTDKDGKYIVTTQQAEELLKFIQPKAEAPKKNIMDSVTASPTPDWQKAIMPYMGYIVGGGLGALGGPGGMITGLGLAALGQKTETFGKLFGYLGEYSMAIEQYVGAISLAEGAKQEALRSGKSQMQAEAAKAEILKEIPNVIQFALNNAIDPRGTIEDIAGMWLGDEAKKGIAGVIGEQNKLSTPALEAGKLYYEAGVNTGSNTPLLTGTAEQRLEFEKKMREQGIDIPGASAVRGLFGVADPGMIQGWDVAWKPSDPNNIQYLAMKEARDRINNGEAVSEVEQDIKNRFGFGGLTRDLIGNIVIDPINVMPKMSTKAGEIGGNIFGNKVFAEAMKGSENIYQGFKHYGIELRNMPIDQAAQYSAVSKMLAGLTKTGEAVENLPKDYRLSAIDKLGKYAVNPMLYGLTPQSKAYNLLNNTLDGAKILTEAEKTPAGFNDVVKGMAFLSPEDAAKVTPEGAPIPLALREAVKPLDELAEIYDNSRQNAKVFENIGAAIGQDPNSIISELSKASDQQAMAKVQEFTDKVNQRAQAGDLGAQELLKTLDNKSMAGNLKKWAEQFSTTVPYDMERYRSKAYDIIDGKVSNYAVNYFGVKPPPGIARLGSLMKNLTTPFVLIFNAGYYMNNLINNTVQMAHDGTLSLSSAEGIKRYWREVGYTPERLGASISPMDVSNPSRGDAIREATRADDWFQKWQDNTNITQKIGGLIKFGSNIERSSGDNALTTAHRKAWAREWVQGRGISKMDDALLQGLEQWQPGISKTIIEAVQNSRKKTDLVDNIYNSSGAYRLENVLTPEGREILAHFPDLVDYANDKLATAKEEDVRGILNEVRNIGNTKTHQKLKENVEGIVHKETARAMFEGPSGAADIIDQVAQEFHDFHLQHWRNMDEIHAKAATMPREKAREYLNEEFARSRQAWRDQRDIEGAKILGLVRGLGNGDDAVKAEGALFNMYDGWEHFFNTKEQEWQAFGAWKYENLPTLADEIAARAATEKRIDDAYRLALDIEADAEGRITDVYKNSFAERLGMIPDQVGAWREAIMTSRKEMAEAIRFFRAQDGEVSEILKAKINEITGGKPLRELSKADQDKSWKRFVDEVWTPMKSNNLKISLRRAVPEPVQQAQQPQAQAAQAPTPKQAEMSPEAYRSYIASEAAKAGLYGGQARLLASYNKHTGEQVTRLEDIPQERIPEWLQKRTQTPEAQTTTTADIQQRAAQIEQDLGLAPKASGIDAGIQSLREHIANEPVGSATRLQLEADLKQLEAQKGQQNSEADKFKIENNVTDSYKGQTNATLTAKDKDGNIVSRLDYVIYSGKPSISMVESNIKRVGGARELVKRLADEYGYENIGWGMMTEDGTSLRNKLDKEYGSERNKEIYNTDDIKNIGGEIIESNQVDDNNIEVYVKFNDNESLIKFEESVKGHVVGNLDIQRAENGEIFVQATIENKKDVINPIKPNQSEQPVTPQQPDIQVPRGTIESLSQPPIEQAAVEHWMKEIDPMLRKAADDLEGRQITDLKGAMASIPPEVEKMLKAQLAKWEDDMGSAKWKTQKYAEAMRDFSLLNYDRKSTMDTYLTSIVPYQFWYTHSMLNWGMRALTRPDIMVNYERLNRYFDEIRKHDKNADTVPFRMRNKIPISLPFLPDWFGDAVYVDPMRQLYPFLQMARPYEQLKEQSNMEQRKAESVIKQMVENEEINQVQAQEAINTRQGKAWDTAIAVAKTQLDEDIKSPADFAFSIYSPQLPLAKAYEWATDKESKSQLPVTKLLQNITAPLGIGGPRGFNIETKLGNPDKFEDYRVDRMLSNMVAEGVIDKNTAMYAMMNKEGQAYTQAQQRVSQMGMWQYLGSAMGVDFFPEGEDKARGLSKEYSAAIQAWKAGDNQALTKFNDKYPEYAVRQASFAKDPEERMRTFLRSEIWQRYMDLPDVQKQQVSEQFGRDFKELFLNKETRSYNDISTDTYSLWAKALGTSMPKDAHAPSFDLKLAPDDVAKKVQAYMDAKDKLFPDVWKLTTVLYGLPEEQQQQFRKQHPEINQYMKWNNVYLSQNKDILPYIVNDKSELYGLPVDQQEAVYKYRAEVDRRFPNLDAAWTQYNAIPEANKEARSQYFKAHPELKASLDFQTQYAKDHPSIANKIISDQKLAKLIEGDSSMTKGQRSQVDLYYQYKDKLFPGIDDKWGVYATLDKAQKKAYWKANPDLAQYMNWKVAFAGSMPEVSSSIMGADKMSQMIFDSAQQTQKVVKGLSPELSRQVMAYAFQGNSITQGGRKELQKLWEMAGRPGGSIDDFMDMFLAPSMNSGPRGNSGSMYYGEPLDRMNAGLKDTAKDDARLSLVYTRINQLEAINSNNLSPDDRQELLSLKAEARGLQGQVHLQKADIANSRRQTEYLARLGQ